jgi:hypothetical protein
VSRFSTAPCFTIGTPFTLTKIAEKYPIDTERLFLKGMSGGAQFVHRLALWMPEQVDACYVHSSSWFDKANPKANQVAWMLIIGESDPSYSNSLDFYNQLVSFGAIPVFRSYIGMVHEGNAEAEKMGWDFLRWIDLRTQDSLGKPRPRDEFTNAVKKDPILQKSDFAFVGDAQDWRYWKNTPENETDISEDSRVYLPTEEIAKQWGKPAKP